MRLRLLLSRVRSFPRHDTYQSSWTVPGSRFFSGVFLFEGTQPSTALFLIAHKGRAREKQKKWATSGVQQCIPGCRQVNVR